MYGHVDVYLDESGDLGSSSRLQVVDFVAGAVFKSLERADGSYLEIIGKKLLHEELW